MPTNTDIEALNTGNKVQINQDTGTINTSGDVAVAGVSVLQLSKDVTALKNATSTTAAEVAAFELRSNMIRQEHIAPYTVNQGHLQTGVLTAMVERIVGLFPGAVIDPSGGFIDIVNVEGGTGAAGPFNTVDTTESYSGNIKLSATQQCGANDFVDWFFFDASGNGYEVLIGGDGTHSVEIKKFTAAGVFTVIASTGATPRYDNQKVSATITYHGVTGHWTVAVRGAKVLSTVDTTYTVNGPIGYCIDNGLSGIGYLYKVSIVGHSTKPTGMVALFPTAIIDPDGFIEVDNALTFNPPTAGEVPSALTYTGNIKLTATLFVPLNDELAFHFYDTGGNGYQIEVGHGAGSFGSVNIQKFTSAGVYTIVASTGTTPDYSNQKVEFTIQIHTATGHFVCHVNGNKVLTAVDTSYVINGHIGYGLDVGTGQPSGGRIYKISIKGHDAIIHTAKDGKGVPNKPLLHLFPGAVMDTDGQRIDLPVITPGTLATYLQSSGGEDFPIDVSAVVQGLVEFFFESGSDGNGYWFTFHGDTGAIAIGKYVAGVSTALANGTVPVSTTIARTLHIRMHANGKFEFQVRNTKLVATDTTFTSLGNNVGVGTFAGGPGFMSKCHIKGHSGIHPDNQDVNNRAIIDFTQPDGGGAKQHIGKNRDNINDTADRIHRPRLHGDHLVDNGNFEFSATLPPPGWQAGHQSGNIGAATLSYDTTTQFAGNRSLRMVGAQFTGASQLKTIHVIPGEVYKLSAQLKANTGTAGVSLFVVDKTGAFLGQFPFLGSSSASWTAVSGTGTIPANATLGYVLTSGQAAGTNDTEIDDVILVRQRGLDDEVIEQSTYSRVLSSHLNAHQIDFTKGYLNKHLGNVPDDSGSSRFAVLSIDGNRRAIIDFTQGGHLSKNLDNIGDGATWLRLANVSGNLATTASLAGNAVTNSAEDRETAAATLSRNTYIAVAKVSYTAFATGDHIRFDCAANVTMTNFNIGGGSVPTPDTLNGEILLDQTAAVGSAIVGGTVIAGPIPVKIDLTGGASAQFCSPNISATIKPPKYTIGDTSAHTFTLALNMTTSGTTLTGNTVAGSTAAPSASIEVHEYKR